MMMMTVRIYAAESIYSNNKEAIAISLKVVNDSAITVRVRAIKNLSKEELRDNKEVLSELIQSLNDKESLIRRSGAEAVLFHDRNNKEAMNLFIEFNQS